jgi:hypothetical protein
MIPPTSHLLNWLILFLIGFSFSFSGLYILFSIFFYLSQMERKQMALTDRLVVRKTGKREENSEKGKKEKKEKLFLGSFVAMASCPFISS